MDEDLQELLDLLRKNGMAWLADEIMAAIAEENEATRTQAPHDLFTSAGPAQISDREALELAIEMIHTRLIQPARLWREAERIFLARAESRLVLMEDNREVREPFDSEGASQAEALEGSLAQLWPGGPPEFYSRVLGRASS
jgi:hypothetical protein